MKIAGIGIALLVGFVLAGCAASLKGRTATALQVSEPAGFTPFTTGTNMFTVAGFYKSGPTRNKVASLYIEGDGFAWIDRYTISRNPTPRNPLALKLAALDPSPTVFYLARPCQYVDLKQERFCSNKYWTNYRFSSDVIQSYNEVLDNIRDRFGVSGFNLVGFSGGGAVAVLVASGRADVVSIRTVAGNLDHVTLNRRKRVSPLTGSLNAVDVAAKVSDIPQIHFIGTQDKIISQYIPEIFRTRAGRTDCIDIQRVSGVSHTGGWTNVWRNLLALPLPNCN